MDKLMEKLTNDLGLSQSDAEWLLSLNNDNGNLNRILSLMVFIHNHAFRKGVDETVGFVEECSTNPYIREYYQRF